MLPHRQTEPPGGARQQVRRMLADPRSRALVDNFASQWLMLRNLKAHSEPGDFPNFDNELRDGFRTETELFFQSIVREDRSVLDLLNADYTFVNERLARHYGIPNTAVTSVACTSRRKRVAACSARAAS